MRTPAAILPLLGVVLLQISCGSHKECESNTDCPVGNYCSRDRFCVAQRPCLSNDECMPGRFCSKDGFCAAQCTGDGDCGSCRCDLLFGLCVEDLDTVVGRKPARCCVNPPAGRPAPADSTGLCEEAPSQDAGVDEAVDVPVGSGGADGSGGASGTGGVSGSGGAGGAGGVSGTGGTSDAGPDSDQDASADLACDGTVV